MDHRIKTREGRPRPKTLRRTVASAARGASVRQRGRVRERLGGPGGDAGEADPRRAAEGEAVAAGKRAATLAGRSARGAVRRLGRRESKEVAEAREERSRAQAVCV